MNYVFVSVPKVYKVLNGNEWLLFTVLFDEWQMLKNEDGWFFRSHKQLKADTGMCVTTIKKCVSSLVEKGLIFNTIHNDGSKNNTFNKANEYKINIEGIKKVSENNTFNEEGIKKQHQMVSKNDIDGIKKWLPSKDLRTKEINNIYNTTGILDLKDLGPKVTEEKKENNIKEKVNEMKREDEVKVTGVEVRPSSNEDDNNNTGGKVYIPKNYEVNSPTSLSNDDMSFDEYLEHDLERRGLTSIVGQTKTTSSTGTVYKAAGDVKTPSMGNLSIQSEKTQPEGFKTQNNAKEVAKTEREAKIASIMSNVELDKDGMLKAKTQTEFDMYFADFKRNLANLQNLASFEAYNNYRSMQGKWWKATVKYLTWFKDPKKQPKQPSKPTVEEMGNYQYHLESMYISKTVADMEKALNRMTNWFNRMGCKYNEEVMSKYYQKFELDCKSVRRTNPIFVEWQYKAAGEV